VVSFTSQVLYPSRERDNRILTNEQYVFAKANSDERTVSVFTNTTVEFLDTKIHCTCIFVIKITY